MMKLRFLFFGGRELMLMRKPESVTLTRESGLPADRLSVQFFSDEPLFSEEPYGVRVERGGGLAFLGIVDEHIVLTEKGMRQESFVCRSMAALLLDSEAMPCIMEMPSLRLMDRLYLKPFGLRAQGTDFAPKRGKLTVEQGATCQSVLDEFAERFLHCTLRYGRDGTVYFSTDQSRRIELPKPKKLTVIRKPSARIGRIVVQNSQTGAYSTVYERPDMPVLRARYLSAQAETAPEELFAEAERDALQVHAVCSGYVDAEPGDRADLSVWDKALKDAEVISVQFHEEAGKSETKLIFSVGERGMV